MEAFADVVEQYAPLNKGHITTRQNIQIHHIPLRDAGQADPRALRRRPVQPRGLRQHRAQRDRRPVGRRLRRTSSSTPRPYAGAYVRYFVRHPTTQLMPRKVKTAFTATDEDRAITGIHDIAFIAARARRRAGASRCASAAARRSCRASRRRCYDFVARRRRRVPRRCAEAVFRIFDRQDWLRVNRARARIKVLRRQVSASTSCAS